MDLKHWSAMFLWRAAPPPTALAADSPCTCYRLCYYNLTILSSESYDREPVAAQLCNGRAVAWHQVWNMALTAIRSRSGSYRFVRANPWRHPWPPSRA